MEFEQCMNTEHHLKWPLIKNICIIKPIDYLAQTTALSGMTGQLNYIIGFLNGIKASIATFPGSLPSERTTPTM